MSRPLRIALLAHSTNPRGGVVHALELGDALVRLGHDATVLAPDVAGTGFFRDAQCETVCIAAAPAGADLVAMVERRVDEYVRHLSEPSTPRFDVYHAQCGISGNALAALKEAGRIAAFARTVHHVDDFADPRLAALQTRSIRAADRHVVVSQLWQRTLARDFAIDASLIGNGVDLERFSPRTDATDAELRARLALDESEPLFVAIGGVEARKNTIMLLEGFARMRAAARHGRLVIAGGASLLDHSSYRARFDAALATSHLPDDAVRVTGPLPHRLMPALYRCATTIAFPSVKEGFGLVVLEALATGVPVVTSRIAPFTEYLDDADAVWCNPHDAGSIADALLASLKPRLRAQLAARAPRVVARHRWASTAAAHLEVYAELMERADA